jgi:hypothetical protein
VGIGDDGASTEIAPIDAAPIDYMTGGAGVGSGSVVDVDEGNTDAPTSAPTDFPVPETYPPAAAPAAAGSGLGSGSGSGSGSAPVPAPLPADFTCDSLLHGKQRKVCKICTIFQTDVSHGCYLANKLDIQCAKVWSQGCSSWNLAPPEGYNADSSYQSICPNNNCWTHAEEADMMARAAAGGALRSKEKALETSLKGKQPASLNQDPLILSTQQQQQPSGGTTTAVMMQEPSLKRDYLAGIARQSGLVCIVGMALLAVVSVSRRRRRQKYTTIEQDEIA